MRNTPEEINDDSEESESEGSRADYNTGDTFAPVATEDEVSNPDVDKIKEDTLERMREDGTLIEVAGGANVVDTPTDDNGDDETNTKADSNDGNDKKAPKKK